MKAVCCQDDDDVEQEDSYVQKLQRAKVRFRAENRTLRHDNSELRSLLDDARLLKRCRSMCRAARKAGMDPSELGLNRADLIKETLCVRHEVRATMPDPVRTEPGGELEFDETPFCASELVDKVQDIVEGTNAVPYRGTSVESPSGRRVDVYAQTLERAQTQTQSENTRLRKDNGDLKALVEKLRLLEECRAMCRAAEKAGKDPADLGFDYEQILKEKEAVRLIFESQKRKNAKRSTSTMDSSNRDVSSPVLTSSKSLPWLPSDSRSPTRGDVDKGDVYRQTMQDIKARTTVESAKLGLQNDELRHLLDKARELDESRQKYRAAIQSGKSAADLGINMEDVTKQRDAVRRKAASLVSVTGSRPGSRSSSIPASGAASPPGTSRQQEAPRSCSWSLGGVAASACSLDVGRVGLPPLRC
eukprot:TRINITY_DN27161_c0_g1_i1.p1 TRINITY_DN27161_c0_g1~~TRINITY_DN27161_c0_g1_i1.p1  ORF type:complete len:453 (+),score=66.49 TRINITY_DN27161_c0_g1_i1:109-1359(+)